MPLYGKGQVAAMAKKCHRINNKGVNNQYAKFKENLNPKPSLGGHLNLRIDNKLHFPKRLKATSRSQGKIAKSPKEPRHLSDSNPYSGVEL